MKNITTLLKVLMKNSEMPRPKEDSRSRLYLVLGSLALCCIMIPCCLIVGYISYIMCYALINVAAPIAGLKAEIHILSAFSMIFGFLVILNILYFSSDREHLVPLPFKSFEILCAKFLHCYFAESVMECLVLLSMFVGFFAAFIPSFGVQPFSLLSGLVGTVLIPMLPLCYCAILCLILMALMKNIKNSKLLNHISTLVFLLFLGLFLYSFQDFGEITIENYIDSLANNSNLFSKVLDKLFFTVPVLLAAIEGNHAGYFCLYLLLNAAMFGLVLFIGKYLYQPGLFTVAALGNGKGHARHKEQRSKSSSVFSAYVKKEFRVLLRTRAYSGNCVFINLLWPIGLLLLFLFQKDKENFRRILSLYQAGNPKLIVFLTIGILFLAFVATAMNSVAATAFTREGAHLSLVKYIPVSYRLQLKAKGLISLCVTYPPLLLCLIFLGVRLGFSPVWFIYYAVLTLLAVLITTGLGLFLDSSHPHSTWDDEYSALRGNLNSFFDMAVIMIASIAIGVVGFLLYTFSPVGLLGVHLFFLILLASITIVMFLKLPARIMKNMEEF